MVRVEAREVAGAILRCCFILKAIGSHKVYIKWQLGECTISGLHFEGVF
jgi:hypothetical protein